MNANRKADLQRKLALAPLPKPPAGLVQRIKKEVPKELRFNIDKERERLSNSMMFTMRVAASILILILSAFLGIRFITRFDEKEVRPAALDQMRRQAPATATAAKAAETQAAPPVAAAKPKRSRRAKKEQTANIVAAAPPPPAAAPAPARVAEEAKVRTLAVAQSAMRDERQVEPE